MMEGRIWSVLAGCLAALYVLSADCRFTGFHMLATWTIAAVFIKVQCDLLQAMMEGRIWSVLAGCLAVLYVLSADCRFTGFHMLATWTIAAVFIKVQCDLLQAMMEGRIWSVLAGCLAVLYVLSADCRFTGFHMLATWTISAVFIKVQCDLLQAMMEGRIWSVLAGCLAVLYVLSADCRFTGFHMLATWTIAAVFIKVQCDLLQAMMEGRIWSVLAGCLAVLYVLSADCRFTGFHMLATWTISAVFIKVQCDLLQAMMEGRIWSVLAGCLAVLYVLSADCRFTGFHMLATWTIAAVFIKVQCDLLQAMMEGRIWSVLAGCLAALYVLSADDKVSFPGEHQLEANLTAGNMSGVDGEGRRGGKNLLDWLGFGVGGDTDPYLSRANAACLEGDLSECFKSRALTNLDEFFTKDAYQLSDHTRVVRMPGVQLRALQGEPFEYSTEPRADDSEWDQFVKFVMRKVERFIKSTAIEVSVPGDILAEGRYAPRFIDEISQEINILENKSDNILSRKKLKKLFIPMLIILKLFKLKLLLFLPLILGLASFKKLLGFLAIVVPGLIGFFKLCKPDLHGGYGSYGHSTFYRKPQFSHRPPSYLVEGPGYSPYSRDQNPAADNNYPVREDYQFENAGSPQTGSPVAFRDDGQELAYQGYREYQQQ